MTIPMWFDAGTAYEPPKKRPEHYAWQGHRQLHTVADDIDRAAEYLQRGDRAEALIWLERGLGPRFRGLGA